MTIAVGACLPGCWTESRSVRTTTTPVGRRSLPVGAPFVSVAVEHRSDGASAKVVIARSCIPLDTIEERSVGVREKSVTGWGYLGPLALVALGAAASIQPDGKDNRSGLPITAAIAGGLYVLFFARSGTEETPLPPIRKEVAGESFVCKVEPARDVAVTVRAGATELEGRTDDTGVARLEGELDASAPLEVRIDGQRVTNVQRRTTVRHQPPSPPPGLPPAPPPPLAPAPGH